MSKTIHIKKGLDINLVGGAERVVVNALDLSSYGVKPTDFIGVTPKLVVKEGDQVKAGSPLFYNKYNELVQFTSPVSGVISEIRRGDKRIIEEISIDSDGKEEGMDFGKDDLSLLNREQVIEKMLKSGVWTFLRQRPFSVIADPKDSPKAIVISGFDSAPLAPDHDLAVHGNGTFFQAGLDVLVKLCPKVHLNLHAEKSKSGVFLNSKNVQINMFKGKHPAGNVGVQIHHIDPINKGEVVWYIDPQAVLNLGRLFVEGVYRPEKIIALAGSEFNNPKHFRILSGVKMKSVFDTNVENTDVRYISGNPLTGKKIQENESLGHYDYQLTVLPEGNYSEFLGWALPGISKYSFSRTFLSGFLNLLGSKKEYKLDTNFHGGKRVLVMTGEFEKVFPMAIYPMQLIKACIIEDIDLMEELGIYEVDSEDFALCEFIDTSKTEIQSIVSNAMELLRKEMS